MLKTVVITRRRAPVFAQKIAKSVVLSSAADVFLHHKPPEGTVVLDATVIEGIEACLKLLRHI